MLQLARPLHNVNVNTPRKLFLPGEASKWLELLFSQQGPAQ